MEFNIKSLKVKISFTFLSLFLIVFTNENYNIFIYSLVASLFHECVHIAFILSFKGEIDEIILSVFGGNIKRNSNIILSNKKEILISVSAPLSNIFFGIILLFFDIDKYFAYINIIMGFFNLLPFYSFDGGRALKLFLSDKLRKQLIEITVLITSIIITVFFTVLSVYLFFNQNNNYSLLIIDIFMILSVILNIKDI